MGILLPLALGLLALAVPIVILYMLKQRRHDLSVSSSLLWRRALQDRTVNAPWQRLRRNLLLLLQLLLLFLLVLSLARPFFFTGNISEGNTVVVLDASASMQATDEGGKSRFDRAKEQIAALIDSLGTDARMSLVWAGPSAQVVASAAGNKTTLRQALQGLKASNGLADLVPALTLASASARQLGDATVVLVSDGGFGSDALPEVPARARYISVGTSSANMGITSLSLRDASSGPQLFASIFNSGSDPVTGLLSIVVDGQLRDSRKIDLGPNDEQPLTLQNLPLSTKRVDARLTVEGKDLDYLPTDNLAWVVRTSRLAQNVLLVSDGNSFLEKGISLMPGVKLFKATPAAYVPSAGFGLTLLDAAMPSPPPDGNLLIFAPPNSPLVPVSGTIDYPSIGQVLLNDPLMRFVDLSKMHVAATQRMSVPTWARVLARTTDGDPLLMAGETGGRRIVVVGFDLHKSDLPLQIAFPILLANIVEWLQPSNAIEAPPVLRAGDPISIRALLEADEIRVSLPGQQGTYTSLRPSTSVAFVGTDDLGAYTVQQMAGGKPLGEAEQFAVNLFSRDESNIAPRKEVVLRGSEGTVDSGQAQSPQEIWPWILFVSLAILTVEWCLFNRPVWRLGRDNRRA